MPVLVPSIVCDDSLQSVQALVTLRTVGKHRLRRVCYRGLRCRVRCIRVTRVLPRSKHPLPEIEDLRISNCSIVLLLVTRHLVEHTSVDVDHETARRTADDSLSCLGARGTSLFGNLAGFFQSLVAEVVRVERLCRGLKALFHIFSKRRRELHHFLPFCSWVLCFSASVPQ